MLSTISATNLSSSSTSSSLPSSTTASASSMMSQEAAAQAAANRVLMSKNLINTETLLLNELFVDFNTTTSTSTSTLLSSASHSSLANVNANAVSMSTPLLRMQKYKLFVEQTDQTSTQIAKQINRLADLFAEFRKTIQSQLQLIEQISDPLLNLAKYSFSSELGSIFDGFSRIGRILEENLKHFLNSFIELTLNPIEQISKNFETVEKEQVKKSLDKAFKDRDIKFGKHRKNQKSIDLSSISNSLLAEDIGDKSSLENFHLHQKICEYLSHVYAEKTSSFNQLVKSLLEFYKTQMAYLSNTHKSLSTPPAVDDEAHVEKLLKKFNTDQSNETRILSELSTRCDAAVAAASTAAVATATTTNNNSNKSAMTLRPPPPQPAQTLQFSSPAERHNTLSRSVVKSCENLHIVSSPTSAVMKRSAERSPLFKSGYLLKRPHHQGVRNWLRRKCVAENGYLYIFHAEENESPVKLNLILCNIKVDDHRKFRLFSGSNNRVYDFMAESDEDLNEWVSILNSSKEDALEIELGGDGSNEPTRRSERPLDMNNPTTTMMSSTNTLATESRRSEKTAAAAAAPNVDYLVKSWIREVQSLDGNDRCCDCGGKDADWLVTNLGILVCIECCGIHREMGVHVAKTQSIRIDRLAPSQLLIARMCGNRFLNQIFEASLVGDPSKKLHPQATMEQRQKYIKIKYEQHLFASNQHNASRLLISICESITNPNERPNPRALFDLVLQLFAQNYDLMAPISLDEPTERNLLQLVLDYLDEMEFLFLVEFLVQNRDFPKNEYTINYVDRLGNTSLHHAVMYNRVECARVLLKAMSSSSMYNQVVVEAARNRDGLTPLDLATSQECTSLLMNSMIPSTTTTTPDEPPAPMPTIIRNTQNPQQSKHNRVASDPFNLIKNNHSFGTIKNLPRLLEDRLIRIDSFRGRSNN